ncbi:MAG: siroheme synthase CysG [Neisseria sp.]|nr:siroheme synthase CysG [Neisseria sp.]
MTYFPLFADLRGRPVLVVGGGAVAERKIQSLLDAGAEILVAAHRLCAQVAEWVQAEKIRHIAASFSDELINEAVLIIAATNNENLNKQVAQAAQAAKKLVNVVDRQELCSFIVPAVIDRSPIQIAVSSGGTSPVLARQIRLEIEKSVPKHMGLMAEIAGRQRDTVKQSLAQAPQRRLFWEKLFAGPFRDYCAQNNRKQAVARLREELASGLSGTGAVSLVGAGPGDAGLLTLHALHAIQEADVVLYDALVSEEVLRLVRKDAEKINVGKRARGHKVRQEETNALLLHYARQGRRVVRLKGGDPFVFGRGGEELQLLAEEGIPFKIIPGITAALGASAYAGIPLTHRDLAQSVQFITGQCKTDGSDVDWHSFARPNQTLAVYMGTIRAEDIASRLIRCGRPADTPVAVISNGTLVHQSVKTGILQELPQLTADAPTPALIIIGRVAALHHRLEWFFAGATEIQAA